MGVAACRVNAGRMENEPAPEPLPAEPTNNPTTDAPRASVAARLARFWSVIDPTDHPAAWLAGVGGVLVLVAGVTSSAARWDDLPVPARLAGLLLVHALVFILAERRRVTLPSVARVLAHLAAALAVPSAVSAVATMHGSWRSCTLVGGIVGIVALESQSRRWRAGVMRAAQPIAAGVAAAGAAAITHSPVGILLSALSICALSIGWERRATSLAALGAAAPIVGALAQWKIGPGTLTEIGTRGEILSWGAPVAGVLAAATLAVVAARRRSLWTAVAAAVALVGNVAIGVTRFDVSAVWWACLIGVALIAAQLLAHQFRDDAHASTFGLVADLAELSAIAGAFLAAAVAEQQDNVLPLLLIGVGWALGVFRTNRPMTVAGFPAILAGGAFPASMMLQFNPTPLAAWVVVAELGAWSVFRKDRRVQHVAGIAASGALTLQLVDSHVASITNTWILVALGFCVALVGIVRRRGYSAFESAGFAAMALSLFFIAGDAASAAAVTLIGLVMVASGLAHRIELLRVLGAVVSGLGALAFIGSSNLSNMAVTDLLAFGVVLVAAVLEHRAFKAGTPVMRLPFATSSMLAAGYLCTTLVALSDDRVRVAVTFGIALSALIVGAFSRRTAVTLAGTATGGVALIVMSWAQLATLPMWAWVGVGGLGLIGVAMAVEGRRGRS
jgi:hypothetical protein